MRGLKSATCRTALLLILLIPLYCFNSNRKHGFNRLQANMGNENQVWKAPTQQFSSNRLQQVTSDENEDDDDLVDTLKGTISVSIGSFIVVAFFGLFIFKVAEWGSKATTELKYKNEIMRKHLILHTKEFLERNGFIDRGLSPFYHK